MIKITSITIVLLVSMLAVRAKTGANAYFLALNTKPAVYSVTTTASKARRVEVCDNCKTIYARVTVYWRLGGDTDYYTRRGKSSSGLPLIDGESVAVDPAVIPYGSRLSVPGYGMAKAVDTGSAVVSRKASRACGSHAPVVDLYFERREEAELWEANHPQFAQVTLL